MEKRTKC